MRKSFLSLLVIVSVSGVAAASEGASSPPAVAAGDIPSTYAWYSGGSVTVSIGRSRVVERSATTAAVEATLTKSPRVL